MRLLFLLFLCSTVMGQAKRGPDTARISHPDGSYIELISPDTNYVKVYLDADTSMPDSEPTKKYARGAFLYLSNGRKINLDDVPKREVWQRPEDMSPAQYPFYQRDRPKYDTIGGWHLVSDTVRNSSPSDYGGGGYINAVHAEYLYEVREYIKGNWIVDERGNAAGPVVPHHHLWLDSNKKPIKLKVWQ